MRSEYCFQILYIDQLLSRIFKKELSLKFTILGRKYDDEYGT